MTVPADIIETERIRECDCGHWVERCCHVEGRFVQLCNRDLLTDKENADTWVSRYSIDGPPSELLARVSDAVSVPLFETDDYAAALAAFHEAEEALLRGES